ncbi:MAG: methyltransferase domain-containing protein [Saccharolobus sp.]|uniref:methyltransferase domain-containing protein n=1 Tax=Saccharolobus sp. TaxID=2100761 RepID=UPI003172AAAF
MSQRTSTLSFYEKGVYKIGDSVTLFGHQLVRKILENIEKDRHNRILEIACGKGNLGSNLIKNLNSYLTGFDVSNFLINYAKRSNANNKEKLEFLVADIENIPFRRESFDVIISVFGVSFTGNSTIIQELNYILKKNGKFIYLDIFLKKNLPHEFKKSHIFQRTCTCLHGVKTLQSQLLQLENCGFKITLIESYDAVLQKILEDAKKFKEKIFSNSVAQIIFTKEELDIVRLWLELYIEALEKDLISCIMIISSK